jgi:hypothetical protein
LRFYYATRNVGMNTEEKIAIDLAPLLLIFVVITWRSK